MPEAGPLVWFRRMQSVERRIVVAEKVVCGLAMLVMALATMASVVVRNFGLALPNYSEIGLAALAPLTLIGGALCTYLGSHISVEIVHAVGGPRIRRVAAVITAIGILAFAAIYFRSGWILMQEFRMTGDKLLDLGTPLWPLAALFPVGMALMAFHVVMQMIAMVVDRTEGGSTA
ncbi:MULTISPECIES: TRAP transporter small permease [unclassified Paracoccus (in: a-proteobacteria)]|nr:MULTISPECIES: TRAP transporter small permease [unclassified Paracoccus (in: a-proteobacteria)]MBB1493008.1 TRAP transporter small permease [Paracoccus sp. MC1854]QQO45127.1 TRAP transporter small permease [Paracoccus sp. MC1862]